MTKLDMTPPPFITFQGDDSQSARIILKDGKITFEGDLPVDDAAKLLFGELVKLLETEIRNAFKAGWRTNAADETEVIKEALDSGEEVDWITYRNDGLEKYLRDLAESAVEAREENEQIFGRGADIVITDEHGTPEMAVTLNGIDDGPDEPLSGEFKGELLYTGPTGITFDEVKPFYKLAFGTCLLNLDTGELEIPEGMKLDEAAWRFWSAVRTHILQDKHPTMVRHKKRGTTYEVIGEAEGQVSSGRLVLYEGARLMVYRGEDGKLWWRAPDEFNDGRFEAL